MQYTEQTNQFTALYQAPLLNEVIFTLALQ